MRTFQADPTLIDRKLALRAHHGTSFDPEKRGEYEISEFVGEVKRAHSDLMKSAKTEAEMDIIDIEASKFQKAYAQKWNEQLASHSRIISPMITGPANFPVGRNQKACAAYENRFTKMGEWKERAINAIHKKLNTIRIEEAGGETIIMKENLVAAEAAQEQMKAVNKILRNKKTSKEEKVTKVAEVCGSEARAREIMTPDCMGETGFPHYKLTNNNANIKRMRGRVKEMQAREATPTTEMAFAGGTITDNNEDDRVQIYYDNRPSPDTIKQLKGSGWHWSPHRGVWQRKRTAAAMSSAKQITGTMGTTPAKKAAHTVPAIIPAAPPAITSLMTIPKLKKATAKQHKDPIAAISGGFSAKPENIMPPASIMLHGYGGAATAKPAATPSLPAILTPAPAPKAPKIQTMQMGLGGGIMPILGLGAAVPVKRKRRQSTTKPKKAKKTAAKPKKKAAKPTVAKVGKPKAKAKTPTLTAAQKKRLSATGKVTVKRNGKFVTITR